MVQYLKYIKELESRLNTRFQRKVYFDDVIGISKPKSYDIDDFGNITEIVIKQANLKEIPDIIFELTELKKINLIGNSIKEIPSQIIGLTKLEEIIISYNDLLKIHPSISEIKSLKKLDVSNNNSIDIPPEIIDKGSKATITYLKSLDIEEKKPLNEIKLILVGDGGAGKTSLVKRIIGQKFNKNEPKTHGINIKPWRLQNNSKSIKVNFWDFGGQQIMHATHQFFLSKRCVYLLVLDGRKDEEAEYWLKHVQSFGGDSPIIIVLNKIDEHPAYDLNRNFLSVKFENIIDFVKVSCKDGTGVNSLLNIIEETICTVQHLNTKWANSWFRVKKELETLDVPHISIDEYNTLCEIEQINSNEKEVLLDFLHDLGIILHFDDFYLDDINILDPEWITEAVYKIINSKELAINKGVIELELIKLLLSEKRKSKYNYSRNKIKYIIELMKKFELCYFINPTTILIPDLLDIQEPKLDIKIDNEIKFILKFDFLPKSILPRFIVRMNQDIYNNMIWRTGAILYCNQFKSFAIIKADYRESLISLNISGELVRDYMSAIRKSLKDIVDTFKKLDLKELVPLPDNDSISLEYDDLIGYEVMGKNDYIVGKLRRTYKIDKLLNGIEKPEERKMNNKNQTNYHFHGNQKVVQTGNKSIANYNENSLDEKIIQLINEIQKHEIKDKDSLINELSKSEILDDKGKFNKVLGNIISNAANISSIVSMATSLLG
ncbi:COR domain-containing protein [uncultured Draconibacterium sp.]|uniref:COR domain-containing protein n=1 Tax=uncultured Draconibacterium sp. TaxID=1573823 RepID=UPI003217B39F